MEERPLNPESMLRNLSESKVISPFRYFLLISLAVYGVMFPMLSWTVFSEDDSHLMRVAMDYGWLEHYLVADVYRQLSTANYTPLPLTIYKTLVSTFSLSPGSFLIFMIVCVSLFTAIAGLFIERLTKNRFAAWAAMLLIFSNMSMITLITRFYTMHYIIGGIFALTAMVLIFDKDRRSRLPSLACLCIFLALLSKEVYIVLPPLVIAYALWKRDYVLASGTVFAFLCYLTLRTYILGMSVDIGAESSYFAGFWSVSGGDWLSFFAWYAKSRIFILIATGAAVLLNPARLLRLLPVALMFAAPSLAVSHGIVDPEMHGDRIFFAFDSALAITGIIAVHQSDAFTRLVRPMSLLICLTVVMIIHTVNNAAYRAETETLADYRITSFILENVGRPGSESPTFFVPLNFIQGDLMRVNATLETPPFYITQNCLAALEVTEGELIAFDVSGSEISRNELNASCVAADASVQINTAPTYNNGVLEWSLQVANSPHNGVLFVDRAFAVPLSEFSQQLVRPKPGERYQIFANDGIHWWFSAIEPIVMLE